MNKVEQKFIGIVESSLATLDLKLYLLEYIQGTKTLKVFICKEGMENVNIDDCAKVDKSLGDVFENDPDSADFILEVSSPGLERKLVYPWHYESAVGSFLKLKVDTIPEGSKIKNKNIKGTLQEVRDKGILIEIEKTEEQLYVDFEVIKSSNIEYKFR